MFTKFHCPSAFDFSPPPRGHRYVAKLFALGGLVAALSGCTVVGPTAVRNGRAAYNDAIKTTDNQQMLMVVIHNRYGESSNLLTVVSVTANVRVTASAGVQAGFGSDSDYQGNLVPFSAGAIYEENPTISYVPVGGEKYLRQLLSPTPLATFAQLAGSMTNPAPIYETLVSRVNGIHNPDFQFAGVKTDPRFSHFVALMAELTQAGLLHWAIDPAEPEALSIIISHYAPTHTRQVRELLDLLGLSAPAKASSPVIVPVNSGLEATRRGGIAIATRSLFNLLEIMTGAVEVPEKDIQSGAAIEYPPRGLVGDRLRIAFASPSRKPGPSMRPSRLNIVEAGSTSTIAINRRRTFSVCSKSFGPSPSPNPPPTTPRHRS